MLAGLDDVGQALPLLTVELAGEDDVGYCVYHLLFVGLAGEGVFSVFGFDLRLVFVAASLLLLVLYCEDIGVAVFAVAFASGVV